MMQKKSSIKLKLAVLGATLMAMGSLGAYAMMTHAQIRPSQSKMALLLTQLKALDRVRDPVITSALLAGNGPVPSVSAEGDSEPDWIAIKIILFKIVNELQPGPVRDNMVSLMTHHLRLTLP